MSDEMRDIFGAMRKSSQARRATNRENAQGILDGAGIRYMDYSQGKHLGVLKGVAIVDFWPGTGLWKHKGDQGRGIESLIAYVKGDAK